jgi:hypothetical protein
LIVRPLAPGERVSLDLASIEDWEDSERGIPLTAEDDAEDEEAEAEAGEPVGGFA